LTPIGLTVRAGLSLNARLLIAASVVLTAFLGLTGLTLDRAFRDSALAQVRAALQAHVYALLGAADLDPAERLVVPKRLPEARFGIPGSGLYAQVNAASGALVWRSPSMLGFVDLPFDPVYRTGVAAFQNLTGADGARYFALGLAVEWEASPKKSYGYTFYVAEQSDAFDALVRGFRQSLWGWLVGAAVVLLAVQGLIWRWGLAPLRRVALEVAEIEAGRQSELRSSYPSELRLLTERLNALLRNRGAHLERYRHALADLAHSFNTPLAVIRSAIDDKDTPAPLQALLREQVEGLNRTVEYQLQRAAASGRTVLARPIEVEPAVRKLERTLAKVHADKGVQFDLQVTPRTSVPRRRGGPRRGPGQPARQRLQVGAAGGGAARPPGGRRHRLADRGRGRRSRDPGGCKAGARQARGACRSEGRRARHRAGRGARDRRGGLRRPAGVRARDAGRRARAGVVVKGGARISPVSFNQVFDTVIV